jgi:hypothetical protein
MELTASIVVSTAAIAGLAGGLAFLVVTIVLSIVAVQVNFTIRRTILLTDRRSLICILQS